LGQVKPVGSGRPCKRIEVFDNKNNSTTIYDSIRAAARALNMDCGIISSYLKRNQQNLIKVSIFLNRYNSAEVNWCLLKFPPVYPLM
jgi:hypothetical protein